MIQIALIMCLLQLAAAYHFPIQKQVVGPGGENIDVNIEVDIDMSDIEEVGPVGTDPPPSHKPTLEPTPAPPINTTPVQVNNTDPEPTHKPPYPCAPVAHICHIDIITGAPDCCPELECQKDPDNPFLPSKCLPIRPSTTKPEKCKPKGSRCVSDDDCCQIQPIRANAKPKKIVCRTDYRIIGTYLPKLCLTMLHTPTTTTPKPKPEPKCQKTGEACTPGDRNNPSENPCCPNHLCDLDNLVCVRVAYRSLNP